MKPYRCSVLNCKGNYDTGPKVAVFGFPEETDLKKKWIHSIKRKDFIPSKNSKVSLTSIQDYYWLFHYLLKYVDNFSMPLKVGATYYTENIILEVNCVHIVRRNIKL